jgi:hypothetical protein
MGSLLSGRPLAYLSALVVDLSDGELGYLPDTQAARRAAIIRWRIGLTVLAHRRRAAAGRPPTGRPR